MPDITELVPCNASAKQTGHLGHNWPFLAKDKKLVGAKFWFSHETTRAHLIFVTDIVQCTTGTYGAGLKNMSERITLHLPRIYFRRSCTWTEQNLHRKWKSPWRDLKTMPRNTVTCIAILLNAYFVSFFLLHLHLYNKETNGGASWPQLLRQNSSHWQDSRHQHLGQVALC